jgi:hypothetical protein
MQSNGSLRDGNSERGGQVNMSSVSADGKPAPTAASPVMDGKSVLTHVTFDFSVNSNLNILF